MTKPRCRDPIPLATLLEYWLDDLDETREDSIDQHLLGCGNCSAALQELVDLGGAIRMAARAGAVHVALPIAFVERLGADGLHLRTYRVPHNGSVYCTVAPEDDLLITRLCAPLAAIEQIDVVYVSDTGATLERLRDVPFDAAAGEVVLTSRMDRVRALPASTLRCRLVAVSPSSERIVGEYTFHHTPYRPEEGS